MIRILNKKPKGFDALIQALKDSGFEFLADQILETDPSKVEAPDEVKEDKQKFDQLQTQLLIQTQLMMKFQEDIDTRLKEKAKKNESEKEVIEEKISKLEPDSGLIHEEVLAYLKAYAGKTSDDGSDVDPHPSLKRISMSDPTNLTEATARHLGVDVVRYMALGDEIPASNRYAQTMRKTVTFMTNSNPDLFNEFLRAVKLDDMKGFSTLSRIADELFQEGVINWGRIVALYAFGGYIATSKEDKDGKLAEMIGDFLGFYVSTHLSRWIDEQGGWVSTNSLFRKGSFRAGAKRRFEHCLSVPYLTSPANSITGRELSTSSMMAIISGFLF